MPPRDDNDRLFHRAVDNIRFTLPDGVELNLGEVEDVTFEGSADTPDENFPIRLNPSEAITGTLEADTPISREALMRAIDMFADVNPERTNPPPGYGEFVEIPQPPPPRLDFAINASAASEAIRNISRRITEAILSGEMRPEPTTDLHRVSDAMSGLAYSAAANASLFGTWLQDLNSAWENLGDDYELKDESEYQGTDPISFEELMDFGGESK